VTDRYTPDEREPKLPKWAQTELSVLRNRLRDADRHIEELKAEVPKSNVRIEDYRNEDRYLPQDSRVAFSLDVERGYRREIVVNISDNGFLEVRGYTGLVVVPHVSNVVKIGFAR
jgi:hypothetical protein